MVWTLAVEVSLIYGWKFTVTVLDTRDNDLFFYGAFSSTESTLEAMERTPLFVGMDDFRAYNYRFNLAFSSCNYLIPKQSEIIAYPLNRRST